MRRFRIHELQAYFLLLFFFLMNCIFGLAVAYETNPTFAGPDMSTIWLWIGTIALWVFGFGLTMVIVFKVEKSFFRFLGRRRYRKFIRAVRGRMRLRKVKF
jgi:hypothetical protein